MPVVVMEPPAVEAPKAPFVSEQPAEDSPLYKTDEFRMYCFKVLPCSKRYVHDWTVCPFAHPGEKAKRRDPRVFTYTGVACPDMKKCQRGDACPYAHNVFEYWMHPSRYRTQLCNDGIGCKRKVCFFAHTLDELRVSNVKLLPSDIAAGTDSGFELDPFRSARSESSRSTSKGATAPASGNEALVEAFRAQQQQQAKKTAAALQRTASRGLAAELQQLQAWQQLQAVLGNTSGVGVLQPQVPHQLPVDSLVSAMMGQLRLGGNPGQQPVMPSLGSAPQGFLDVVVQQAVQHVLANNAAQQAAAALLFLQQQQQHQAAVAHQQQQEHQNRQAAVQAHALLEHLLQHQAQQGGGGPGQPHQQAFQAAVALLQQQQTTVQPLAPMGTGIDALPGQQQHPMGCVSQPGPHSSLPGSVRSSATGMTANGALLVSSPSSSFGAAGAPAQAGEGVTSNGPPGSPHSQPTISPSGSPPLETPLSSTLSGNAAAAAALSAAATAASYYSQEVSRSSFESYRSSELDLGIQLPSGHHSSGPSSGGAGRSSLELLHHMAHHSQHPGKFPPDMMLMGPSPSPCSPSVPVQSMKDEALLRQQEARHRQLLIAAAAQAHNSGNPGMTGSCLPPSAVAPELLAEQVAMAAFAAGHQCPAPPFGM